MQYSYSNLTSHISGKGRNTLLIRFINTTLYYSGILNHSVQKKKRH